MVGSKLSFIFYSHVAQNNSQLRIQEINYPVLRSMARDFIGIPGSSCLSERSFSLSGRTDLDPTRRKLGSEKFGAIQRLKGAYRDGQLTAEKEAWMEIDPDFEYCSNTDISE